MPINPSDLAAGDTLWSLADRCIFHYGLHPDDDDWRGDPLAIDRRYDEALSLYDGENAAKWMRDDRTSLQFMALEKLWPALVAALGLPELDERTGEGYTGEELLGVLRRFRRWKRDQAERWRLDAEMIHTYPALGSRLTYEGYVGLAYNRERVQCIAGVAAWRAAVAASGRSTAYFGLVDAMAPTLGHARELAEMIESNRAQSQAWAEKNGHA